MKFYGFRCKRENKYLWEPFHFSAITSKPSKIWRSFPPGLRSLDRQKISLRYQLCSKTLNIYEPNGLIGDIPAEWRCERLYQHKLIHFTRPSNSLSTHSVDFFDHSVKLLTQTVALSYNLDSITCILVNLNSKAIAKNKVKNLLCWAVSDRLALKIQKELEESPLIFDDGQDVYNIVIVGDTGAGKSYFANGLLGAKYPGRRSALFQVRGGQAWDLKWIIL